MKIAIMGFGTVGSGAYEVAKAASDIEVKKILDLKVRPGYEDIADRFTTEISDITTDADIELVIEAMGGIDVPKKFVLECLNAGKHVVTPNKNLISACYKELTECAAANGVSIRYTPSAGGGIPWLFNLARTRRCDTITEVRGIVNGTANYILDNMHENGADFGEVLKKAQELGYAEANPAADIEGTDTLRKTVISSNIAYGTTITENQVPCYGIDTIDTCDIEWFNAHGYTCKLMMKSKLDGDKISACVEPALFTQNALEANVKANFNLISLVAESVGPLAFYGQGAGSLPTGQSVIEDVIDIRDGIEMKSVASAKEYAVDNDSILRRYYIRHNRMCEHIEPMIESFEEKDGIYYCISKPVSVSEMHAMGQHRKERGKAMFFASISE